MIATGAPRWRWSVAGLGLLATIVLLVHLDLTVRRSDRALLTYDSAEFALAGRHLARTGTLATWFVHPDELGAGARKPPFPLIVGHPLVPILNAAAFAALGPDPANTLIPAGLAYLALVVCAALLGRRLSGSAAFGLVAGAAVALSARVLYFAAEGLSEMPFVAAWMAALVMLWDFGRRPRPFALGLILGLAHLARPIMVPLLGPWLLGVAIAAGRETRGRALLRVLAGFLACALPLALYKLVAAGDPFADVARFNLLTYLAPEFTPERVHRMLTPPSPLATIAAHPGALMAKIVHFGPAVAAESLLQAGWILMLPALVFLAWPGPDPEARPVRHTIVWSLVVYAALVTVSLPVPRYLFPLLPMLIVVAVAGARGLLDRSGVRSRLVSAALAALLIAAPASDTLRLWRAAWPAGVSDRGGFRESEWRALHQGLQRRLPAGAVVASDIGPHIAWYTGRAAVLIPNGPEELPALERRLPLGAIVLTNVWLIGRPGSEEWRALFFARRSLAGWSRADSVTVGRLSAVVFLPAR